jgi:hypothetical protein
MSKPIEDHIRSFGMSGYLVNDELRMIEDRFKIELGHSNHSSSDVPKEYYPQFEQAVRSEASEMSRHYELFYCLETSIRKLICEVLQESAGSDWWTSGRIPANVVNEVKERAKRELDSGMTRRSDDEIDYTTFGELSVIITSNWDLFGTVFSSRRAVEKVMNSLNLLRGPIAHCCPISDDEVLRLQLTVKDWFRMFG